MIDKQLQDAWEVICARIKTYDGVNIAQMNAMFSRLNPQALSEGFLMLTADNEFIKNWCEINYLSDITRAVEEIYGTPFTVFIEIDTTASNAIPQPVVQENPIPANTQAVMPVQTNMPQAQQGTIPAQNQFGTIAQTPTQINQQNQAIPVQVVPVIQQIPQTAVPQEIAAPETISAETIQNQIPNAETYLVQNDPSVQNMPQFQGLNGSSFVNQPMQAPINQQVIPSVEQPITDNNIPVQPAVSIQQPVPVENLSLEQLQAFYQQQMNQQLNPFSAENQGVVSASLSDEVNETSLNELNQINNSLPAHRKPTSSLTFENFVIGDSNRMAYSMALEVAENPGRAQYNPLFIYGKSGLGKTHLLRSIQNQINQTMPQLKTCYADSQELLSEYTSASIQHDKHKSSFNNFLSRYDDVDVLLIDDVQHLQGKTQTLNMVFQIFNKLTSQGKQVVLAADRAPKNIDIDERYQSRFNSGGTCDIQPPSIETKLGVIKGFIDEYRYSEQNANFDIPNEIQLYIAEASSSNIREIKSAVTKVITQMTLFDNYNISLEEVKQLLKNHFSGTAGKRLSVEDIQENVGDFYKISQNELTGKKRSKDIAWARHTAIWFTRQYLDLPYQSIGKYFGNRDHTTVRHSCEKVDERLKSDREYAEELEVIQNLIRQS